MLHKKVNHKKQPYRNLLPKKWLMLFILIIGSAIITACQQIDNISQIDDTVKGEFAGERCITPREGSGVVTGLFTGHKQTPFQNRGSGIMPVSRYRCFKTVESCEAWLDVMTNLYNVKGIEKRVCVIH